MREINYSSSAVMRGGFPKITKKGAVSPNGESTPFVFGGRLMRLELSDPSHGTDTNSTVRAIIRDRESGKIISSLGEGCYYYSLFTENDVVYVLGTLSLPSKLCGDTIIIYESRDLLHWERRELLSNPGWQYFNSSLVHGDNGYILLLEANEPAEFVGENPFTCFFASSPDMKSWTMLDYSTGYSKARYMGGPCMKFSRGWYYLISVTALPCARYTNYIYRTRDFDTWEVGFYNPILMPDDNDRIISPYAYDLSDKMLEEIKTGFVSSNSDIDMCEFGGKTIITYNAGNQLGFYFMAEAEYDGGMDELLARYFE